jgi:hypothetical protein
MQRKVLDESIGQVHLRTVMLRLCQTTHAWKSSAPSIVSMLALALGGRSFDGGHQSDCQNERVDAGWKGD